MVHASEQFATYPSLRDEVVLISGGATGLGAEFVAQFAAQGARVAFVDLQDDAARALVDRLAGRGSPRPSYWHVGVRVVEVYERVIGEVGGVLGPVGVLINNAANDARHTAKSTLHSGASACGSIWTTTLRSPRRRANDADEGTWLHNRPRLDQHAHQVA